MVCLPLWLSLRIFTGRFTLSAIHIDMGFAEAGIGSADSQAKERLAQYAASLGVPFYVVPTSVAKAIFIDRKEKNPCSLCSKLRRGALCTKCGQIGAGKLALAHHAEDVLATFMLSFMYEGRLSTLQPYSFMSRTKVTVIRPLIYAHEGDIKGAAARHNMPVIPSPCPKDKSSSREYMKQVVKNIQKEIPFAKDNMISAIISPERYNLWNQFEKDEKK